MAHRLSPSLPTPGSSPFSRAPQHTMSQLNLHLLPMATASCKVHSWEGEERTGPEGRHQLYSNWEVAVLGSEHGLVEEASTLGDYVPWSHGPLTSPGGAQLMARTGALASWPIWGEGAAAFETMWLRIWKRHGASPKLAFWLAATLQQAIAAIL